MRVAKRKAKNDSIRHLKTAMGESVVGGVALHPEVDGLGYLGERLWLGEKDEEGGNGAGVKNGRQMGKLCRELNPFFQSRASHRAPHVVLVDERRILVRLDDAHQAGYDLSHKAILSRRIVGKIKHFSHEGLAFGKVLTGCVALDGSNGLVGFLAGFQVYNDGLLFLVHLDEPAVSPKPGWSRRHWVDAGETGGLERDEHHWRHDSKRN